MASPIPLMQAARPAGARKLRTWIRLRCGAANQRPSPKLGQALGPLGINMMQFCKKYNEMTTFLKPGTETPLKLFVYADKTFEMELRYPSSSWFLKQAAGIEKGSADPKKLVGKVDVRQIYEIAKYQQREPRRRNTPLESICKSLVKNARSLGLDVVS